MLKNFNRVVIAAKAKQPGKHFHQSKIKQIYTQNLNRPPCRASHLGVEGHLSHRHGHKLRQRSPALVIGRLGTDKIHAGSSRLA